MDVLTRLAALIIAILLAIDAFSGERSETVRVERHSHSARWHRDDDYRLHLAAGRVESCAVGWPAWSALRDGDEVVVDTSRVFKTCDGIRRADEAAPRSNLRGWLMLLPIALLLAAAFGWIQFERRVGDERGWWFS